MKIIPHVHSVEMDFLFFYKPTSREDAIRHKKLLEDVLATGIEATPELTAKLLSGELHRHLEYKPKS